MTTIDLEPATRRLAELVRTVPDDRLDAPTPCAHTSVGALLNHIDGFGIAFTSAARKESASGQASFDGSHLGDDWRNRIPQRLDALAAAWREPDAWTGMTAAGGLDLPGEVAGVIALDEVVLHGWDVARAIGRDYDVDDASLEAIHGFVAQFSAPEQEAQRQGLFG